MSTAVTLIVVSTGLVTSVVVLALAIRAGRSAPVHPWAYGIGIASLTATTLFHSVIAVVIMVSGGASEGSFVVIGALALAGALAAAVLRPAWGGWVLIATGLGLPALLWLLQVLAGVPTDHGVEASTMLGFYGIPAMLTGAVLVLSAWRGRSATPVVPMVPSVQ